MRGCFVIEQDDVKRIEEIQTRLDGAEKPGKIGHGGAISFHGHAIEDVTWLLQQLAASRQECERLRGALMDARRDEGYP